MTHDELIEAAAKAIYLAYAPEGARWELVDEHYQETVWRHQSRAAISVIAPAVLREALGAMTELEIAAQDEGMRDYVSAFRDANQAVRALKTRYEP